MQPGAHPAKSLEPVHLAAPDQLLQGRFDHLGSEANPFNSLEISEADRGPGRRASMFFPRVNTPGSSTQYYSDLAVPGQRCIPDPRP